MQQIVDAQFPAKLQFLFKPKRYKIAYGGRGGTKSWGFARALLILGAQKTLRILCARETQKSIADSVYKLLCDQISALKLEYFYSVTKTSIVGANGTEFTFAGIRQSSVGDIKSYEGCDICWVEEAQIVSKHSWEILIPTIRKDGSEIWVSFNPDLETDETYKRFVVSPPASAHVEKINWRDNPWFPDVLKQEMLELKAKSPDDYEHVYEGVCKQVVEGAIYRNELIAAEKGNRITRVPYDAIRPVDTFWDIGFGDNVSIWFAQSIGFEFRIIDFMSDCLKDLSFYLRKLQEKPYVYGFDYLPHDAQAKTLAAGGRSVENIVRASGRKVRIVPRQSIADGIEAARSIFNKCWFDAEKCADGIQALRHYRYDYDDDLQTFKKAPRHDWASHPADAFRYLAVSIKEAETFKPKRPEQDWRPVSGSEGWMA
jgi:phage terminase large subunit